MILLTLVMYLFTTVFWISLLLSFPLSIGLRRGLRPLESARSKRLERRKLHGCLAMLSASLGSGTSFRGALSELEVLFEREEHGIKRVVVAINRRFDLKKSIDPLKSELPTLLLNRESVLFFDMMIDALYSGANRKLLIERTGDSLQTMIELEEEIDQMLNEKKMEAMVISVMPVAFVFLLRSFFDGYLDPLQGTGPGALVLWGALALILVAEIIMFRMISKVSL